MRPLKNFVLVGEAVKENVTDGGIVLTTDKNSGVRPGKILAVGPEIEDVNVGDVVYCDWPKSIAVTHDGKPCVLLKDEFIMAVE